MGIDRHERKTIAIDSCEIERLKLIEAALTSAAEGVVVIDSHWRVVFINDAGKRLVHRALSADLSIAAQAAAFNLRYPDDRPVPPEDLPLARALRGETVTEARVILTRPDGTDVYLGSSNSPIKDGEGNVVGAVAVFRDVTGRHKREDSWRQAKEYSDKLVETANVLAQRRAAELQSVLDNMLDGVYACDVEGRVILVNEAGVHLLGFDDFEQTQRALPDFPRILNIRHLDGTPVSPSELPLARALIGEIVVQEDEIVCNQRTHRDMRVRTNAAPIRNDAGEIVGAVEVARDVTELTELDELKDQFIAVAAHELKTPVAVMKGYAQMLLRASEGVPASFPRMFEAIARGADRIDAIVKDLLDVSQLHLGQTELVIDRIDLPEIVEQIVARTALNAPTHRIRLVRADPVVVHGDRDRLESVLTNLIDNAIRYSPYGGEVDIAVAARQDEVVVSVADHGVGIPRNKQARIFQRFYRAHDGSPYDYGGMGVGLYISRETISRHHGRMWFESEEGAGSTFYFSLPLSDDTSDKGC
ncbi:MAG: PAS domain-containing protein [Chloroflexi bacterium]|nr:PAS domain-containing protein [Chloroflexota bacterium]